MLHLLYSLAFTAIAFLAISNLIRNLIALMSESNRRYASGDRPAATARQPQRPALHPELLDASGRPVDEPLLVMRSVDVEEAREKLDALYNASPNNQTEISDES